ncbi:hypothetical protein JTE90_029044 [Oedothorax gibbosus]|uniref:Uncharacterized protein n=1 Tax=Oedothorax gibbosus TaxID=931172 RepID=A0AAV6UXQ1_9ARAC|nr:hypothetical protein JTE90_029044 [Oedothorax gibbosus]
MTSPARQTAGSLSVSRTRTWSEGHAQRFQGRGPPFRGREGSMSGFIREGRAHPFSRHPLDDGIGWPRGSVVDTGVFNLAYRREPWMLGFRVVFVNPCFAGVAESSWSGSASGIFEGGERRSVQRE